MSDDITQVTDDEHDLSVFADREAWLEARRTGLGSTDAPAVLGVSRFSSPYKVYAAKLGIDSDSSNAKSQERRRWGLKLQKTIIEAYGEDTGDEVKAVDGHLLVRSRKLPWLITSPDGWVRKGADLGVLEVKTASAFDRKEWVRADIPLDYQVQAQHHMAATGLHFVVLAVLIGGNEFFHATIPRDEPFIDLMLASEREFWEKRVLAENPPDPTDDDEDRKLLGKMFPTPAGTVDLSDSELQELDAAYVEAHANFKKWESEKDRIENIFRARLGEAAMGRLPNGTVWSNLLQSRRGYTVQPTKFRVLRRLGGK